MSKRNRARYAKINSMAKLREEQMRISWEVKLMEDNLCGQYNGLKEAISVDNITSLVVSAVDSVSGVVGAVIQGVTTAISFIRKLSKS